MIDSSDGNIRNYTSQIFTPRHYLTGLKSLFVPYLLAVVSCPSLTAPNNAIISAGDDSYKTERTFSCSSGYTSSGTDRRTCQANGKWSGNADFACTSKYVLTLILNPDPWNIPKPKRFTECYCKRRNFPARFNFVFSVLLAESTKFCSIRKPYKYKSVCDTALAVHTFIAYESLRTLEYGSFMRTEISAITVPRFH